MKLFLNVFIGNCSTVSKKVVHGRHDGLNIFSIGKKKVTGETLTSLHGAYP